MAAVDGASSPSGWVLTGKLPQAPTAQLIGPHVRFNDHDPITGTTALSVLVVTNPSLSSSTVQLHWAVNGPAMTPAPGQLLDEFMVGAGRHVAQSGAIGTAGHNVMA